MEELNIIGVEGKGDIDKECVWLDVLEDIQHLQFYMISDSTYIDDEHMSNELRHMFWFPTLSVSAGDYVKLFTKRGRNQTTRNKRGTTTHVLHWGLGRTVWNKGKDQAVLFALDNWKSKNV